MAMNLLAGIFSRKRLAKAPELSKYVTDHSGLDEYVHDQMYERASRFREAVDLCPEVDIEDEDGRTVRKRIDAADGLNSDLFFAFHDERDVPKIKAREEVRPSREFGREVMSAFIEEQDFKSARARTRGDDIASACAMIAAEEEYHAAMAEHMKEHLERAQQMHEQEEILGGGPPEPLPTDPQARWEALQAYGAKRKQARETLGALAEAQAASGMNAAAAQAVASMAEAAKDVANAYASLPGVARGEHGRQDPDEAIEMAQKWLKNHYAKQTLDRMGRLERDMRFKHSTRTPGGAEIPVNVEMGNELPKLLSTELLGFSVPELKLMTAIKYATKQMLQYEMVGTAESGKGPFIPLLDLSGSMDGTRHIEAKAVLLSMLSLAQRERRAVHVIGFQSHMIGEWAFPVRTAPDLSAAFDFVSRSPSGGTTPWEAEVRAEEILRNAPAFRQADVVVITDGDANFSERDLELKDRLTAMGVRIYGISIDCRVTPYLAAFCDHTIEVTDFSGPNEATDMLVQTVI